jgi:hypothetical protein
MSTHHNGGGQNHVDQVSVGGAKEEQKLRLDGDDRDRDAQSCTERLAKVRRRSKPPPATYDVHAVRKERLCETSALESSNKKGRKARERACTIPPTTACTPTLQQKYHGRPFSPNGLPKLVTVR